MGVRKMPRGGKRIGAGRPRQQLDADVELFIWFQYHRVNQLLKSRKRNYLIEKHFQDFPAEIKASYNSAAADQARMRRYWTPAQRRAAISDPDEPIEGVTLGDVRANLAPIGRENARRKGFCGPHYPDFAERVHTIPLARLYGRRDQIIDLAAKRASKRFKISISKRMARQIIESYCRLLRLDDYDPTPTI